MERYFVVFIFCLLSRTIACFVALKLNQLIVCTSVAECIFLINGYSFTAIQQTPSYGIVHELQEAPDKDDLT
jgi:hypothetical protein